ncbi:MAG: alanine dehydrogenase [Thermotaleaceae bacterium]
MRIGVPMETASGESRVGITHIGVKSVIALGGKVYMHRGAGIASGITDEMFEQSGAVMVDSIEEVYEKSDLILKVKPPSKEELEYIRANHILFSYVLPERHENLTRRFMETKASAIGYEGIEDKNGKKPLLIPMSEIAGKMAVFMGANLMQTAHGGTGLLLSSMAGIPQVEVVVMGAGSAGLGAVENALGLGSRVSLLNRNIEKLREARKIYGDSIEYVMLNHENLCKALERADLVINTIDLKGDKVNHLISKKMLGQMKKGSVIMDVACDIGGAVETSIPTTHESPCYVVEDIIHCAIPNLPGTVPKTATIALSNATLPYIENLVKLGIKNALLNSPGFRKGLFFFDGYLLHKNAADNYALPYTQFEKIFR